MTPRKAPTLFTIGYQSTTVAEFLRALTDNNVELLVDVRRIASSRRPGFAKSSLRANLESAGIAYEHLRSVGTPAEGRAAARAGKHEEMKQIVLEQLATDEGQGGLDELERIIASGQRTCIMCFEHDHTHCHRTLVAAALGKRMPLKVVHLEPDIPV